jgi:DNA-binding MarR family transcriptional regulator
MKIDDQLRAFEAQQDSNWQGLIFNFRKHLDIWTHKNISPYWGQVKLSYMPVIFNIAVDGSTAVDLARESMIVKQTISRTVKELEENGMIEARQNDNDKRSEVLELTKKGKQFVLDCKMKSFELYETYKEVVGEKDMAIALEVINKIISYHENLYAADEEQLPG